jgi:hypothetical protein
LILAMFTNSKCTRLLVWQVITGAKDTHRHHRCHAGAQSLLTSATMVSDSVPTPSKLGCDCLGPVRTLTWSATQEFPVVSKNAVCLHEEVRFGLVFRYRM